MTAFLPFRPRLEPLLPASSAAPATWRARLLAPGPARVVALLLVLGWMVWGIDAPLVEDSLFWWVPKALLVAQDGPARVLAGPLPQVMAEALSPTTTPPQWAAGLPDYGHPTLWYLWLGLFLKAQVSVVAIHLACFLPAAAAALGFVELGRRLGNPWAGLTPFLLPPVLAQLWRPELDLPLLALVPWALVALADGAWRRFALLAALATLCKEPGVLLLAPAVLRLLRERRFRLAAFAPLLALGAWALLHPGGLARPETLPSDAWTWLSRDLLLSARLVFIEQGRFVMLLALPFLVKRWGGDLSAQLCMVLGMTWLFFFSMVGFSTGSRPGFVLTHVRYFVPGMAVLVVMLGARWPVLALPGLLFLHSRSPYGPEGSLWGIDVARAEVLAAPWIAEKAAIRPVWVGSHQAAGLSQPWAGRVDQPLRDFRVYSMRTAPDALAIGSSLVVADYGEPAGALIRGLRLAEEESWTVGEATVRSFRVLDPSR